MDEGVALDTAVFSIFSELDREGSVVSPVLVLAMEIGGVEEATGRQRQLLGQPLVTLLPEDGTRGQLGVATHHLQCAPTVYKTQFRGTEKAVL